MDKVFAVNLEDQALNCNFAAQAEAEKFFSASSDFRYATNNFQSLPEKKLQEFAFIGRSNAGKSSLINALTKRRNLARVSVTPGRTQTINFFEISNKFLSIYLVDLPGYGYAKAPTMLVDQWLKNSLSYLKSSQNLQKTFILLDSRHGLKKVDFWFLEQLSKYAVAHQVILTKIDKSNQSNIGKMISSLKNNLASFPLLYPDVILTSSQKKQGINLLQTYIYQQISG